ncbi:MAG: S8 family serine peptidase [Bacteroidales bacterium]|nr:S8 family serine peptidase [Bacteroidales bacterium]
MSIHTQINDPLYNKQFYLNNTGQFISSENSLGSGNGTSGVDINVESVWNIANGYGNSNIRVAIIDDGIEPHSELSNLIEGWPTYNTFNGKPERNGKHGQACAGIIGASHNNSNIAGIAPNVTLIPIRVLKRISNDGTETPFSGRKISKGINYAWEDLGADVLSISMRFDYDYKIKSAINWAMSDGRDDDGCIVVACTSNFSNGDQTFNTTFPADLDYVIAVGALNKNGTRALYSKYLDKIDLVAPSSGVYTTSQGSKATGNIRTIDREGDKGYTDNDYNEYFGGTSASCPQVAGVAALVLSANPSLSRTQVTEILQETANRNILDNNYNFSTDTEHPDIPWNEEVGHGLVDATKAVLKAKYYSATVSGSSTLNSCNTQTYTFSDNIPSAVSISWIIPDELEVISGQGTNSIEVMGLKNGTHTLTAKITLGNRSIYFDKSIIVSGGLSHTVYNNTTPVNNSNIGGTNIIAGDFKVSSGRTVTLSGYFYISPNANIFVEQGGHLIIDGATLTSLCDDNLWSGISVYGDKNLSQTTTNQGKITVKNNAIIENAETAIRTWESGDYNTTGGIINASNSTFRNNKRSIEFIAYKNMITSTIEASNISYFTNCSFTIDNNNNFSQSGVSFTTHVSMWGVNKIPFRGCTFENITTFNGTERGKAITSSSAGFTVTRHCSGQLVDCDCLGTETFSSFNGFSKAIDAYNSGSNYTFTVSKADFTETYKGIIVEGINDFSITECDFDLSVNQMFPLNSPSGIELFNSSGFKIEANLFYTNNISYISGFNCTGIYANNLGISENLIYRNEFKNLWVGTGATGINGSTGIKITGLQYQCNTYDNVLHDIRVYGNIRANLGSASKGADNSFINRYYPEIDCSGSSFAYYCSNTPDFIPTVHSYIISSANSCASTLCNNNSIIITKSVSASGTDSDNSANSDEIQYEILQQQHDSILVQLSEIVNNSDATSDLAEEELVEELSVLSQEMAEISNDNISTILEDSVVFVRQDLEDWLNTVHTPISKYNLCLSYCEQSDFILANTIYDSIPLLLELDSLQLIEYSYFGEYLDLYQTVYADSRTWAELSENEMSVLLNLVDIGSAYTSSLSNSILCFFYAICAEHEYALEDINDTVPPIIQSKSIGAPNVDSDLMANDFELSVYPNPANYELSINIDVEQFNVKLTNTLGSVVVDTDNVRSIDLSQLPQGTYVVSVQVGEITKQNKITIVR